MKSLLEEVINQLNYETASTVLILALQLDDARKYGGWNSVSTSTVERLTSLSTMRHHGSVNN